MATSLSAGTNGSAGGIAVMQSIVKKDKAADWITDYGNN